MDPVTHVRVKICCIAGADEARLAVAAGAAALGLVGPMPSGPGQLTLPEIAAVASTVPPAVGSFLLTSSRDSDLIGSEVRRCRVNTVQICDALTSGTHARLRRELPGVAVVQVVHVTGDQSVAEAVTAAADVDAILLDSGTPRAASKTLGGTGRTHDWAISRRIRQAVAVPVFLAGGLRPDNVAEAIAAVGPFGVDVCNGVRTAGRLDPGKLTAFMAAVRNGRAPDVRPGLSQPVG